MDTPQIENFLATLGRKALARVILASYDCPSEGRAVARQALAQFGHEEPRDIWGLATDGKISDRDIAGRVNGSAPWIVEVDLSPAR